SRSVEAMRAYELGNTFLSEASAEASDSGLPCERESLCIAVFGEDESFFTLKGIIEQVLAVLGVGPLDFEAESRAAAYHPGRCARISCGGKLLGLMGQVNPAVQETYDLARPVYAAELSFEDVYCLVDLEKKYRPLPKYPAMKRDFALVVTEEVRVADIEREIRAQAGELLESVQLFDIYRGGQVPKGSKSIAFSLTYRAGDRTLKEAEVNEINERVLTALKQKHRAVLREM
ncbi:MAG: phenylalanine--tRNA ligase subunit beta, partial [Anaerovoracaceae bacterium]